MTLAANYRAVCIYYNHLCFIRLEWYQLRSWYDRQVRQSTNWLSLKLLCRFGLKFCVWVALANTPGMIVEFWKIYFSCFFTHFFVSIVNTGPYGSEHFKSLLSKPALVITFCNQTLYTDPDGGSHRMFVLEFMKFCVSMPIYFFTFYSMGLKNLARNSTD